MTDLLSHLRSVLGPRYAIERELGRGGMATVYLAMDLKHHRHVALKFLHPEVALTIPPERFLREIEIAAKLNHPNILALLDSGDADGLPYYVMPYLEGESLRDQMRRLKQIPVEDALRITREVADAMSYAHHQGIVHRDIKPENILFQAGHAVLADFGIARAFDAAAGETATATGVAIGTPAYMSPEQGAGERDLDGRSDIYSLGCVLYEMLVGHSPFAGATAQETIARHAMDPVPTVRAARNSVTEGLELVIRKALAKQPADRFATAERFAEALAASALAPAGERVARPAPARYRRLVAYLAGLGVALAGAYGVATRWLPLAGSSMNGHRPMLAVLPFENLGPADQEYFADGLTEELTAKLASLPGLGVISRTSVVQYKKTTKGLREVGRDLGVEYVLEGTIRWQKEANGPSRVRITPQLIRVSDDTHLWTVQYDETLSEVFTVQSSIAAAVAQALDLALLAPERLRLEARQTRNLDAYDSYLRGNATRGRGYREDDLRLAIDLYQTATRLDSGFALAWTQLSRAHADLYWANYDRGAARLAQAKDAADHALRLAPELPEAHLALGYYYYYHYYDDLGYDRALQEFQIAALAQPSNGDAWEAIANVQRRQGRWQEAIDNFLQAATLGPRSYGTAFQLGRTLLQMRRYEAAEHWLDRAITLGPEQSDAHVYRVMLYLNWQGDLDKARAALAQGLTHSDTVSIVRSAISEGGMPVRVLAEEFQNVFRGITARPFGVDRDAYYLARAAAYNARGQTTLAAAYYDSARVVLEPRGPTQPWVYLHHSLLGFASAGAGRREDAVREGRTGSRLLPRSKDAAAWTYPAIWLAQIYAMVGEDQAAIDQVRALLQAPSLLSSGALAVDPIWSPLRRTADFTSLAQKTY